MDQSTISNFQKLSSLDWFSFLGVSLISLSLLIFSHRKNKSSKFDWLDYLLMGRSLSLPLFVGSLVATWYGGIFGVTRIAYESGIYNFITQGFFWYLSYLVFALFLVGKIRKSKAVTLADLVGKQFGPMSEKLAAIFNFINVVPVVYTISLGILLQSLFQIPFILSCSIGLCLVLLYTSSGGLRAVVLTDIIQFFIMFIGVGSVFFFALSEFGGLSFLRLHLPETHFSVTGGHSIAETLAWGFIAFSTLVDPNFYHRVFAARTSRTAKMGILISILFWFIFDIFTTFGAMYARAAMPSAEPANAYFMFALDLLPSGMRGLFLGGIVACILSTLDSYIFTASNTLLYDFLPKGLHTKKRNHVLSHIFVCVLALGLAVAFEGNIKVVWKTLGSYSSACLLFPVLLSQFSKVNLSDKQFVVSCLLSILVVSFWRNYPFTGFLQNIDELYMGVLTSALCFGFFSFQKTFNKRNEHSI